MAGQADPAWYPLTDDETSSVARLSQFPEVVLHFSDPDYRLDQMIILSMKIPFGEAGRCFSKVVN